MEKKKKLKIFKIMLFIIAIIILTVITIYLFPVMINLSTKEGQIIFKNKVSDSGTYGLMLLFLIQIAQIFLFILPGEPIEILAGMCYGWILGTVFIMISSAIIATFIFWLVRKIGRQFVYDFSDEEKIKKIENSKIFQNPKKIELVLFILFLVPGTPKDLLTYLSGLLPIKMRRFVFISYQQDSTEKLLADVADYAEGKTVSLDYTDNRGTESKQDRIAKVSDVEGLTLSSIIDLSIRINLLNSVDLDYLLANGGTVNVHFWNPAKDFRYRRIGSALEKI